MNKDMKQALEEVAYAIWEKDESQDADLIFQSVLEGAKFYRDMGWQFEWDEAAGND